MARSLIPNSTQVPDVILDHWMAELSGTEFKVLMYIARRTYGFGKESDNISLTQIAHGLHKRDGTILDRGVGSSRSGVARSLKELEERGLIIRESHQRETTDEFDENTYHINLDWQPNEPEGGPGDKTEDDSNSEQGVVSKRDHPHSFRDGGWSQNETTVVSKRDQGWSQNETRVVSFWYIQETDIQETDQETAAAQEPDAAAVLISELTSHGVSRRVAEKLATEKPEICKRCLQWLPFAKIRTTAGAWLANAIAQEFGPPEAFVKAEQGRKSQLAKRVSNEDAPKWAGNAENFNANEKLILTLRSLEKSNLEAFTAFEIFCENEETRVRKFADLLTEERRSEILRTIEDDEHRLTLFAAWLQSDRRKFRIMQPSEPNRPIAIPTG